MYSIPCYRSIGIYVLLVIAFAQGVTPSLTAEKSGGNIQTEVEWFTSQGVTPMLTTEKSGGNIQTEVESLTSQGVTSTLTTEKSGVNTRTDEGPHTSVSKESTTNGSQGPLSENLVYVIIGTGTLIIICVIGCIVCALRNRKKSVNRSSHAALNRETSATMHYQDLETTRRQANPDGTYAELQLEPVYEEVSERGN